MTVNQIKKQLKSFQSDKRYEHSLNVAKAAIKLAEKYNCDKDKAELAGLLHDIMKEENGDNQLKIIAEGDVRLSDIELSMKKLWHQISSMVYARDVIGVEDEDVLNAIRYHTSGRGNMSLLEKIIFVADVISDDRNYNGVKEMRKIAYKNLDEAIAESIINVINDLTEEKKFIIPDCIDAYNDAILKISN
ncbi:MAG: bis(5'-nucleosyl)-tetraphosphatase (symmetrical) YqeK [Clostridia bacterium]